VDFVVVGFGLGAITILLGIVMGAVAARWDRAAATAPSPADAARDSAVAADRRVVGLSLLYAGGAILLATIGALAGSLDDGTGAYLVATTVTVAAAGILFQVSLQRSRRPLPRRRRAPRGALALPVHGVPPLDDAAVADSLSRLDAAAEAIDSARIVAAVDSDDAQSDDGLAERDPHDDSAGEAAAGSRSLAGEEENRATGDGTAERFPVSVPEEAAVGSTAGRAAAPRPAASDDENDV
jgi:hypothetical protein